MDFPEKARIRMEHWIKHNDQHQAEYAAFAKELEAGGHVTSAEYVRQMEQLAGKSNECLLNALQALTSE